MSQYRTATVTAPTVVPPTKKRFPFEWPAFAVSPNGEPPVLTWPDGVPDGTARLRFTVALDDREEKTVQAALAQSGEPLGTFDLRYADALQTWELPLSAAQMAMAPWEGISLRMVRGWTPLYVFSGASGTVPETLLPHLLLPTEADNWTEFRKRLLSLDSIETFGWQEGCVLDGLLDLRDTGAYPTAAGAARAHLDQFFTRDCGLTYEDPRGEPSDGRLYGVEATLPFGSLARVYPDHPMLSLAAAFWKERTASNGSVTDGKVATAEGAYCVAYPMARLAVGRGQESLARMALFELRLRRDRLAQEDDFFLRFNAMTGERTFKNWTRGVAWYLLGLTRTLIVLGERADTGDLREDLARVACHARTAHHDCLWGSHLDDPHSRPDTVAVAGLAAAFALGAKHGLLAPEFHLTAAQTLSALTDYLTPDGFLCGAAQSNKGGEALQKSPYRVMSKSGMGLIGVLISALKP